MATSGHRDRYAYNDVAQSGCFGIGIGDTLSTALIRNLVLIVLCVPLLRTR